MSKIFLVRHGQTEWNAAGRYQGRKNSALTVKGRYQALRTGEILKYQLAKDPSQPVITYVSPLGRAQETADIIGRQLTLSQRPEVRIIEVALGCWDGMSMYEITTANPDFLTGIDMFDWYFRSPDGESFDEVHDRVRDWLDEVAGATEPIVAISHGLTGRIIRGLYSGLSKRDMLELPVLQDVIHVLEDGEVQILETDREGTF